MTPECLEDAGKLLSASLRPRQREAAGVELVRRFRAEPELRLAVESVARGMGLRILGATDHVLILAADEDSPFALKLENYHQNLGTEDRLCHGLIQVAVAAWCFPTSATLDDEHREMIPVKVPAMVEWLVKVAEEHRSGQDPPADHPELAQAWRVVLSRARTRDTGVVGKRTHTTLSGMVGSALDRLVAEGLMRKEGEGESRTYRTRPAYRLHVRELASHEAFAIVSALRRGEAR